METTKLLMLSACLVEFVSAWGVAMVGKAPGVIYRRGLLDEQVFISDPGIPGVQSMGPSV